MKQKSSAAKSAKGAKKNLKSFFALFVFLCGYLF
jgi:hypothetical protein